VKRFRKTLLIATTSLVACASAFGATLGIASAVSDSSSSGPTQQVDDGQRAALELTQQDNIPVVDSTGAVRGTVRRDDLYIQGSVQAKAGPQLVKVYDDKGDVVGYYGNYSGFVEKSVAEQPGFDQMTVSK
jgi:hypothetical protein